MVDRHCKNRDIPMSDQTTQLSNTVPSSIEAEESLLGAVLISPSATQTLDIKPEDFYIHRYGWIWAAITGLIEKGHDVDVVTISEALERAGKLNEIGGTQVLLRLATVTPTSLHAESYANIVKDLANRRRILDIANALARAAYDESKPVDVSVISATTSLTGSIQPRGAAVPLSKYVGRLMDDVEYRVQHPTEIFGLQTDVLDFDKTTGGLQLGEVLYIGGDPGIGKSILSIQKIGRAHV